MLFISIIKNFICRSVERDILNDSIVIWKHLRCFDMFRKYDDSFLKEIIAPKKIHNKQ